MLVQETDIVGWGKKTFFSKGSLKFDHSLFELKKEFQKNEFVCDKILSNIRELCNNKLNFEGLKRIKN